MSLNVCRASVGPLDLLDWGWALLILCVHTLHFRDELCRVKCARMSFARHKKLCHRACPDSTLVCGP